MTPIRKTLVLLTLGVVSGVAIWWFSPWLTGQVEPWDADTPIWLLSWLLIAVTGGLVGHVRGVCLPLGYALGQMLVTVQSVRIGEFGALGWMFIGGYAVIATIITLALVGGTALLKRVWRKRSSKVAGLMSRPPG
ncbi:membrane hypothetical protein [Candidatus Competibacter denitrificans Run_A_D11]|uniref:Uncharacterized protein n=1 Tax=Candidatus Competibacter denitrificans Run_A_D11 TaxID=1400863 RepID=W6M9X4_9GAMM|nr:hypothetical protein [Candidatus Competibacter denitrificans]CDI03459.1 membrane hypothetical protein [Candidatus Competibacter denitrificans Run_A_D11]HAS85668.1 hypothetical protein [Candidatus Competibacteraceae bacterium]HRC69626.1 hypothetical protein [Candidatus Competibacter denitrificans]